MASVVFILGAGASKSAGAPVMANFLDMATDLWKSGKVADDAEHFKKVFETIRALQTVHSKAELDLNNIESVFATLDIAKMLGKLPGLKPSEEEPDLSEKIESIISSLRRVIVITLEQSIAFGGVDSEMLPTSDYNRFTNLVKYLRDDTNPRQTVAIITFNYDIAIDHALEHNSVSYTYGRLPTIKRVPPVPLLKLHGSLNWAYCSECKGITERNIKDQIREQKKDRWERGLRNEECHLSFSNKPHECRDCKIPTESLLVPPTWNKTIDQERISKVWQRAAKELGEAEHIFIIGYSLPPTDEFFKLLYALGTVDAPPLRSLCVYNPNPDIKSRFKNVLGRGAIGRFEYSATTFEAAIEDIQRQFSK